MPDLTGHELGRYHLLEKLGEGGMAIVYKAYDTRLECDVAVKVIRTDQLAPAVLERALKRFEREAKSVARLTHSNIVKVTDFGEYDGMPYLVMEYLSGGTLKEYLKVQGKIDWRDAVKILMPIADALDYAHEQNLIHRDVKPANILLTSKGQPMLTDFGVAKIIDEEVTQDLTGTSATVGTPEYMAPEQVVSKTVDHRADVYALGVVFYEMVTGRRPFEADTPMAVLFKHAGEPLPRPSDFIKDLPEVIEKILFKALAKKPEDRYQSMGELISAFKKTEINNEKFIINSSPLEKPINLKLYDDRTQKDVHATKEISEKTPKQNNKTSLPAISEPVHSKESKSRYVGKILGFALGSVALLVTILGIPNGWFFVNEKVEETGTIISPIEVSPTYFPSIVFTPTTSHDPILTNSILAPHPSEANQRIGRGSILNVIYIEDEDIIIIVSTTGVYRYNAENFELIDYYEINNSLNQLFISKNGKALGYVEKDNTVKIKNLMDGSVVLSLNFSGQISQISLSDDNQYLVVKEGLENQDRITVWAVGTGNLVKEFPNRDFYGIVALSNNAEFVAIANSGGDFILWNPLTGQTRLFKGHGSYLSALVFSPNSDSIATSAEKEVTVWNVETMEGFILPSFENYVSSLVFSPDGTELAIHTWSEIELWDLTSNKISNQIPCDYDCGFGVEFINEQKLLYSSNGLNIFNFPTGTTELVIPRFDQKIVRSNSGDYLIAQTGYNELAKVDIKTGRELMKTKVDSNDQYSIKDFVISPDGSRVAVTTGYWVYPVCNYKLTILDSTSFDVLETENVDCLANVNTYSSDGDYLVLLDWGGIIIFHDQKFTMKFEDSNISSSYEVVFAHNSSTFTTPYGSNLALMNAQTGEFVKTFKGDLGTLMLSAAFSPDNTIIAGGSDNNRITLWNVNSKEKIQSFTSSMQPYALTFSLDGKYLAYGLGDGTIELLDLTDGTIVYSFLDVSQIESLIFSNDGKLIISETTDQTITFWPLQ